MDITTTKRANRLTEWERSQAPSRVVIVRLLNLLRTDAPLADVEAQLKIEPLLSYRLLRFVNSASAGFHRSITSFRQAVTVLGYHQLHRWLAVLLVASDSSPQRSPLIRSSLIRAAMMESLSADLPGLDPEQAFLIGVFSRIDELFGQPIPAAIAPLNLAEEIGAALVERAGPYGDLLSLTAAVEASSSEVNTLLPVVGIEPNAIHQAHAAAVLWVQGLPL